MQLRAGLFKEILNGLADGVYFVDVERHITFWSQGAERITGYPEEEALGIACAHRLLGPLDTTGRNLCEAACPLAATLADGLARNTEAFLRHAGGQRVPVLLRDLALRDTKGRIVGAVETLIDHPALLAGVRSPGAWEYLGLHDTLTGVGSRRFIAGRIETCLAELQRLGVPAAVLFCDIDHFGAFNQLHGKEIGDAVLAMVAQTLERNLRGSDAVGRWGGEEFVAVLQHVDGMRAAAVADKLRMLVERSTLSAAGGSLHVTVSVGATMIRAEDSEAAILARATSALASSKAAGCNCVTLA
jgi:diguanylate cyclase (GGDEF)-like protein/PAS domain S-box-containing protein